ncbi:MAG: VOC family protein [Eubacterium sp.]
MAVQINGINHCAISVANLEETIQWYSDVFGFTVVNRSEIPGAGIRVAHLQGVGFLLEVWRRRAQIRCRKTERFQTEI